MGIRARTGGRIKHVVLILMENHTSAKFDKINGFILKIALLRTDHKFQGQLDARFVVVCLAL